GPHPGDAGGTADRRVRSRRGIGRKDHGGRDRPAAGAGVVTAALTKREDPAGAAPGSGSRRVTQRGFPICQARIIAVPIVFVAVTTAIQPSFLNEQNIKFLLVNTTVFALLALGETMVVISRNVDLSVGSVLGLSAYVSAGMFGSHPGIPIPVVFLIGLGI